MSKRPHIDQEEVEQIRNTLLAQLAVILEKDEVSVRAAITSQTTLLDGGVASVKAPALKRWAFLQLEAELTTFELLKT